MPNWVTTEIQTHPTIISALVGEDGKYIDFNRVLPFAGPHGLDMIDCAAEDFAQIVAKKPLDSHPLIRSIQASNRDRLTIESLSDEQFEQFILMLKNYRACGYFHSMDFAREVWGTKWNACESTFNVSDGTARFSTAWSYPSPVMISISKRFPDHVIHVKYADEDLGSNCGTLELKGGAVITSDIAPNWHDLDEDKRTKWRQFAADVKGWELEED